MLKNEWDKVAKFWDKEAGDKGISHQRLDIDPIILKIIGDIKNRNILEIGCGNGYLSRSLAKQGAKVTAIDISSKFIQFATRKEETKPLGITYFIRDAANLHGLKSNSYDFVIGNMCLMDVADIKNAIKNISKVLKKNGSFVFSLTHPFHESQQQWIIIKDEGKKYLARAIHEYLSCTTKKSFWSQKKLVTPHYHRPLQEYFKYLKEFGFLIRDFREISSKQMPIRATKEDGNVKLRRSRFKTLKEKEMKIFTTKEIPSFLIIEAIKVN